MPYPVFTNPLAAFRDVDWRRGRYNDTPTDTASFAHNQFAVDMPRDVCYDFTVASGSQTVLEGTVMTLVPPANATTPPQVKAYTSGDSTYLIIGVAIAPAVVGQRCGIVTRGFVHTNQDASPAGFGSLDILSAGTQGAMSQVAFGTIVATTIVGTLHGFMVGTVGDEGGLLGWCWKFGNPV